MLISSRMTGFLQISIRLAVKPLQVSEHFHFRIVYKDDFPDWTSGTTFMVVEGYPRTSYDDLCTKKYLFLFLDLENPCFLSKSVRVVNSLNFERSKMTFVGVTKQEFDMRTISVGRSA